MSVDYTRITEDESELGKMFLRDFTLPVRTQFIRVGPEKTVLPEYYLRYSKPITDFQVRQDDVWVLSHPRTGTTWTQEMVWCILNDLDFKKGEETLVTRFPCLEYSAMMDMDVVQSIFQGFVLPPHQANSVKHVADMKSPRAIKCHLPWNLLPRQLQDATKQPKIVYVSRNAKDTCVSYYHFAVLLEGYSGSFDDFCNLFLNDSLCFGPFWSHVSAFWKRRQQSNILFLQYEDMIRDLPAVIRKTASFLGKPLTAEQVSALASHLSFESMRNNKAVNFEETVANARLLGVESTEGNFIRKGAVGDWNGKMDDELVKKFDAWTEKHLRKLGTTDLQ